MKSLALLALLLAAPVPPRTAAPATPPTAAGIEASAPADAWRPVMPGNLLLIDTARGQLVIELSPDFAPAHVAAVRKLVRAQAFTGGAVVRVQDNYVVQFAAKQPQLTVGSKALADAAPLPTKRSPLPAEYERLASDEGFMLLPGRDAYADEAGFSDGWPIGRDAAQHIITHVGPDGEGGYFHTVWPLHCYGTVGVGRDNPPDTGDGSELYAVIGHAPRHLDRNMAIVGRVIAGIEGFASLPRGTEALGFYKTAAERLPITGAAVAADLPEARRPRFEVMRTETPTFAAIIEARANRREPFFVRPAGRVDICNVRVPVRRVTRPG